MQRWIGIRASAVIAILGSLLTLLFAAVMVAAVVLAPMRNTGPLPAPFLRVVGIVLGLLFAAVSVWGIATGAGIFRRRAWARVSMVIFSALLLFFGGTGVLTTLFLRFPVEAGVDLRATAIVRAALIAFYALISAIGVWWLILFSRTRTRQYFAAPAGSGPWRPLSISAVGWYLLVAAVFTAVAAVVRMPFFFFGWLATGWAAMALCTAYAAVQIYLGSGLLQLDERARVWSIVFFCLAGANGVVMLALPDFAGRMREYQTALHGFFGNTEIPPVAAGWWITLPMLVFGAIPLWFLISRRAAFAAGRPGGPPH